MKRGNSNDQSRGKKEVYQTITDIQPKVKLPEEKNDSTESLQNELGWLGRLFGGEQNSITNIIGIVALFLTLALSAYVLMYGKIPSDSYITLLMTILGYLFGKR